jgi:peptidoglycan hydrolase-like protein with peptidoglycan-binding domain
MNRCSYLLSIVAVVVLAGTGLWNCSSSDRPEASTGEATAEASTVPAQPVTESETSEAMEPEAEPAATQMTAAPEDPTAEEFWQDTVWVEGKEGKLVRGLDGGEYEPYKTGIVQDVQQELKAEGVYDGTITGVLDEPTMQAIGEYQENHDLQACGVPTPLTRESLLEG